MSVKRLLLLGICGLALVASPALAIDRIAPGFDSWITPADGSTRYDFSLHPIPAGFFCPGSTPFAGQVTLRGVAIKGADGADTLVQRLDEALFDKSGLATTRLQVRGLSLESIEPITTSCGSFRVRAVLAGGVQPITSMKIQKEGENNGTFESRLALRIKLVFEPLAGGKALRLEDTVNFDRPTVAPWVALPGNEEIGTRAAFVDLNGDGKAETRLAGGSTFFAGSSDSLTLVQTTHCAAYSGTTCIETHVVEPCECCNLCAGCQCP